jgi:hypothetical protein
MLQGMPCRATTPPNVASSNRLPLCRAAGMGEGKKEGCCVSGPGARSSNRMAEFTLMRHSCTADSALPYVPYVLPPPWLLQAQRAAADAEALQGCR